MSFLGSVFKTAVRGLKRSAPKVIKGLKRNIPRIIRGVKRGAGAIAKKVKSGVKSLVEGAKKLIRGKPKGKLFTEGDPIVLKETVPKFPFSQTTSGTREAIKAGRKARKSAREARKAMDQTVSALLGESF